MSLRCDSFSPQKPDDSVSAAGCGLGLTLLGVAVAAIMLGAVFPEFFDPGFNQSGFGFP